MRKLIIRRRDSFIGWAKKLSVYISDEENNELEICKVPCRKLGDLPNGRTAVFDIDEKRSRVFVISGKGKMDLGIDSKHIPEGGADYTFEGQCKFNPARFNAYVFDGEPDIMAKRYIQNGNRNGIVLLAGIIIFAAIVGLTLGGIFTSDYFGQYLFH